MKLLSVDNSELMNIDAIERDGSELIIKGKVFGAMPLTARLTPQEARSALRLIGWKTACFLVTLPFRRG